MKTVKEIAALTGVSVRTLHYYHQIGLLKPSGQSNSGYRLYSDDDLSMLQQILFLKELDFPLKSIKSMLCNTDEEKKEYLLKKQKDMLILKRNRLNELIALLDNLKKGEKNMSFKEFDTSQMDALFTAMLDKLDEKRRNSYILEHGGDFETARKTFGVNMNKNKGALERYTGEQDLAELLKSTPSAEDIAAAQEKIQELNTLLAENITSKAKDEIIQNIIFKLREAHKMIFPVNNLDNLFLDLGRFYLENEAAAKIFDEQYGAGFSRFFGEAVLYFYEDI